MIARAMTVCLILAGSALSQPATPPQPVPPTAPTEAHFTLARGPFKSATADVTLHDAARDKDLELRLRVPLASPEHPMPAEGWPLVVFSHGAGGSRDAFPDLLDFWASHGYASVAPTHSDSIQARKKKGEVNPSELFTPAGRQKLVRDVSLTDRVADCVFILDHLAELSTASERTKGPALKADPTRFAVAGHSAGAFTAQLCAGVKGRAAGLGKTGLGFTSIADDRFKAAIIISGQGTKSLLLGEDSWSAVKVPLFVITGSLDTSPPQMGKETPESRQEPFLKSRGQAKGGPPAYLLFIDGATHGSYQGKATASLLAEKPTTEPAQIQSAVAAGTTLFLDAHLRASDAAKTTLNSGQLTRSIPGKVRFEHK